MRFLFSKPAVPQEDILKQLIEYEVIILMDDSQSMEGDSWMKARKVTKGVVKEAIKYDRNGIELQFLNNPRTVNFTSADQVKPLFEQIEPSGSTPLGPRLEDICNNYLNKYKSGVKRCLVIAITDGVPNSQLDVTKAIKDAVTRLEELEAPLAQLGIQFVQIGSDSGATRFLEYLDDNLKGDGEDKVARDIVDTVPYRGKDLTPERLVKILAGAINRRVDNQTEVKR